MSLCVMPLVAELSYRLKCVTVEDERVFGELVVTRRNSAAELQQLVPGGRNLTKQYLEGPDFLELERNAKPPTNNIRPDPNNCIRLGRSKSWDCAAERREPPDDDAASLASDGGRRPKIYPVPPTRSSSIDSNYSLSSLVERLLFDIYGTTDVERHESDSTNPSTWYQRQPPLQAKRLQRKGTVELKILLGSLRGHVNHQGGLLVRQLRRRDYLLAKREKLYNVITAHLQAHSRKRSEDTRMRFSLSPQPGESGFIQWLDAMKMVAKLQGGIPAEFRRKLWVTLAERHLEQRGVDWKQAEKLCFNEWSNPDDEELGIQIVKDLHRTGCSLFCGAAGRDNQAVLRRVLLGFARWNKSVGYCQGLNVLAALILQVVDRDEAAAVKVMIHLIEGVLPEAYFADNLRGLSIDMAVFRDLLRIRLPGLSKHLESLQHDPKDKVTGSSYEPPLTNVFTMQWFLTLFCHCLPQDAVLRVWDLIFLEGDDVLLRTALAIWEGLSDRIMTVTSADEFYSIMGVLTREMLEFTDTNHLVKTIVSMGPLTGITNLREKHRYNITPWSRRLSDDDDTDTEDDDRLAVAAAAAIFAVPRLKKSDRGSSSAHSLQAVAPTSDRERLALDISTLKQQYAKLRERQRQAHIILSAACARQSMVSTSSSAASQAMNHLLVGKSALVSGKGRLMGPGSSSLLARANKVAANFQPSRKSQSPQPTTIHWKDMKERKDDVPDSESSAGAGAGGGGGGASSDSDSTSTELCDEPDRLSDLDTDEPSSSAESYAMATAAPTDPTSPELHRSSEQLEALGEETSIAQITDQIRRLSAEDAEFKSSLGEARPVPEEDPPGSPGSPVEQPDAGHCTGLTLLDQPLLDTRTLDPSVVGAGAAPRLDALPSRADEPDSPGAYSARPTYVIGHLSIAPISFDSRKSRASPDGLVARNTNGPQAPEHTALGSDVLSLDSRFGYKIQLDTKRSPKSPESAASFSSGETQGPDSIVSSVAVTPLRSDSRGFALDKSVTSSASSESKTLTMRSPERKREKSTSPLTDSLAQPELQVCSSTESCCSPSKLKSEERDFSSDLQSPISANSIKFTTGYAERLDLQTSSDIGHVTSPFYPILNPDQKTPSPHTDEKNKSNRDVTGPDSFRNITQDNNAKHYPEKRHTTPAFDVSRHTPNETFDNSHRSSLAFDISQSIPVQSFDTSQYRAKEENISIRISSESDPFDEDPKRKYSYDYDDSESMKDNMTEKEKGRNSAFEKYRKYKFEDELQETDTLSPLPQSQFENRSAIFERTRGRSLDGKIETSEMPGKTSERSSSSLEKRFPDMLLSPSMEDFDSIKKRSSDVLEDLRHLEAKTTEDGEIDPSMLTRKTSFIWEDLKSLEQRRQDTFSDSASGFSKQKVEVPGICVSTSSRKTYVVEPKINIDENSDSILKSVTYKNSNGHDDGDDDDAESTKFGVWTKVKPRKRNDSGRRSSDRALKIIQENSAILQKILTCQARKRLPDLEEISKQITISPINEEISKIFSPILEKMGLNEHEINEELARISFKDLDRNTTTTTASEFEAKINEELSKLSLVGDNEEVAYLPDVDDLSSDYLLARDAFIDHQMNAELSKILAHYSEDSPASLQKVTGSSSLNASDDLSTSSTNAYSYESSNDSLNMNMKSELSAKDQIPYSDNHLSSYTQRNNYITSRDITAKSDVDIYRELEKLDQISYSPALPTVAKEIVHPDIVPSTIPYIPDVLRSPKIDYPKSAVEKQPTYDLSPLKSPYNSPYSSTTLHTTTYDYKSRISPRKDPSNPYSVRSYDPKSDLDLETGFENSTFELTRKVMVPRTLDYEYGSKKHLLTREHLEFRVKYDPEDELTSTVQKSTTRDIDLKLSPFQTDIMELDKGASYYTEKQAITPTNKYSANKNNDVTSITSTHDRSYDATYQRRKYEGVSPVDKYSMYGDSYDSFRQPYKITNLDPDSELSSYLANSRVVSSTRSREVLSPTYQYSDYAKSIGSSYTKPASPNFNSSISPRFKNTYSDLTPTDTMSYRSSLTESKQFSGNDVKYNFDGSPSPKSLGFSPFPVRNVPRKPKEVALKLGLYSPTNTVQSKRS